MGKINWLAVVASVVAGMAIGFLWYGALFQTQWMAGNGITLGEDAMTMYKHGVQVPTSATPMIVNTISMVVYALLLHWLLGKAGAHTLAAGAAIGAVIGAINWLMVVVGNLFAANASSLSLIDGSYSFVLFLAMGAILGGWRKK